MSVKAKLLVLALTVPLVFAGREIGKTYGAHLGERLFGPIPKASKEAAAPKAWPDDEVVLAAAISSSPFTVVDRNGKVRPEVTWVGNQTIQRADGTCVQITRENPRITADGKSQKMSVSETIAYIDCPTSKTTD